MKRNTFRPVVTTAVLLAALIRTTSLSGQQAPARRMLLGRWEQVAQIDREGELLLDPQLLVSSGDTLFIFDYGDMVLKAIDRSGHQVWAAGRRGGGPGEFANPTSLELGPDHLLWLSDPANGRITRYSTLGRFVDQTSVTEQLNYVLPLTHRRFAAVGNLAGALMQWYDSAGRPTSRIPEPDSLKGIAAINRQSYLAGDESGIVIFFRRSDLAFHVTGQTGPARPFFGPERTPFAPPLTVSTRIAGNPAKISRANPRAAVATHNVTDGGDHTAWVLFGGATADSSQVVDSYDLRTGRYIGSRRLPMKVKGIVRRGSELVGLVSDPVPSLYVWRWIAEGGGRR